MIARIKMSENLEYNEGYDAFKTGIHHNPYCKTGTSKQFWSWEGGWNDAKFGREKK
jgi:hypothetical protein